MSHSRSRPAVAAVLLLCGCVRPQPPAPSGPLKDTFAGMFKVGAAVNPAIFTESDVKGASLVKAQ